MATQITADLPTLNFPREVDYPTQEDWAAFSAAAELNFGILGSGWSTQMQLWKTQANAMSTELNTNATIAQGLANYQGDWTSKGYTLNQTVSVSGVYYICKLTHATGQNPTDSESLYWNLALGNWNLKINTNMSNYTLKVTPVDNDLIALSDSVATFGIKKLSWANIKATLKTYFDSLYATTAYVDGKMVLGTAVNSTTGTSIDFTSIPSWVKKITVMFNGVSTNGTSIVQLQIGSTTISTTGYIVTGTAFAASSTGSVSSSTGFFFGDGNSAAYAFSGKIELVKISGNQWVATGGGYRANAGAFILVGASPSLAGALDRLRLTTVNGTDTFDGGSINIMYEG